MNFLEQFIVRMEAKKMFDKLREGVAGYKTYVVAGLAILLPLIGFLFGPLDIHVGAGTIVIPHVDFPTLWTAIQVSGLATTLRAAISRVLEKKPAVVVTASVNVPGA